MTHLNPQSVKIISALITSEQAKNEIVHRIKAAEIPSVVNLLAMHVNPSQQLRVVIDGLCSLGSEDPIEYIDGIVGVILSEANESPASVVMSVTDIDAYCKRIRRLTEDHRFIMRDQDYAKIGRFLVAVKTQWAKHSLFTA